MKDTAQGGGRGEGVAIGPGQSPGPGQRPAWRPGSSLPAAIMALMAPAAIMALMALAGCSGADFKRLGSDFADHVARKAGVEPAGTEEPGKRAARARDFARRTDRLEVTAARNGSGFEARPGRCARDRCDWPGVEGRVDGEATPATRSLADLFPADIAGVALEPGTRQMTGFEYRPAFGPHGRGSWGVWMQHSVFGIAEEPGWTRNGNTGAAPRYGFAGGDMTGSSPSYGTATWTGDMVGTVVEGPAAGTRLAGDASLAWSSRAPDRLEARITGIRDNANGRPWSVGDLRFEALAPAADGTFRSGDTGVSGDFMGGAFYGPDHDEAAGVFEKDGITGAFGAARR